jgi:hypothetical protein
MPAINVRITRDGTSTYVSGNLMEDLFHDTVAFMNASRQSHELDDTLRQRRFGRSAVHALVSYLTGIAKHWDRDSMSEEVDTSARLRRIASRHDHADPPAELDQLFAIDRDLSNPVSTPERETNAYDGVDHRNLCRLIDPTLGWLVSLASSTHRPLHVDPRELIAALSQNAKIINQCGNEHEIVEPTLEELKTQAGEWDEVIARRKSGHG